MDFCLQTALAALWKISIYFLTNLGQNNNIMFREDNILGHILTGKIWTRFKNPQNHDRPNLICF